MAIYGTPLTLGGGGGGKNDTLPPLLDNFKANKTDGIFLKDLPYKTKVKLGRYGGKELKWLLCRDSADKSLRLILDGSSVTDIGNMPFDAAEPSNSDSDRRSYGNSRYIYSNIHQWLNSNKAANQWYTSQHGADAPPDYQNKDGFLKDWTTDELSVLLNKEWTTTKADVDGGGTENFTSKVTLPSTTEMGLETGTGGSKLDIFNSDEDRNLNKKYWCRNSSPYYTYTVGCVNNNGRYVEHAASIAYGVRPLLALSDNTLVSSKPDSEGYYTIVKDLKITLSADKMPVSRAADLAGAVWVYGDHIPNNVNDGTKIELNRNDVVSSELGLSLTLGELAPSTANVKVVVNIPETDGNLHPYIYLTNQYYANGVYQDVGILLRDVCTAGVRANNSNTNIFSAGLLVNECSKFASDTLGSSIKPYNEQVNIEELNYINSQIEIHSYKCFILSKEELGFTSNRKEGKPLPYFDDNTSRIAKLNGNNNAWWSRTIESGLGKSIYVTASGNSGISNQGDWSGFRPAIAVSLDLPLNPIPKEDGSYDFLETAKSKVKIIKETKQTVGNIPSKSKVKLGRYGENELLWLTTKDAEGRQYLRLDSGNVALAPFKAMMYDNKEPNNTDTNIRNYGNNMFTLSNLFQWLNSDKSANNWYTPQHAYDAPPPYANQDGFLKDWTEQEKQIILNKVWETSVPKTVSTSLQKFTAKVVVPSITEVGISSNMGGSKLDIYANNSDRVVNGSPYWTRSADINNTHMVRSVDYQGGVFSSNCIRTDMQVVPLVSIPVNTPVELGSDGTYHLLLDEMLPTVSKTVDYPKNKHFFARQFTYNPKKQYQTMLEGAIASPNLEPPKPEGQQISQLPSRSKVKLGKVNNTVLKWVVCKDTVDQSTRLILDASSMGTIGEKMFDNQEPSNSNNNRRSSGNNRYIWSNIHQWLNTNKAASSWYTAQHGADAPPDYANQNGFLNQWTEKEIKSLELATWVVTRANVDGGGTESFQSKIVLPSTTEMGDQTGTGGNRLDIFNNDSDRDVNKQYWLRNPFDRREEWSYVVAEGGYTDGNHCDQNIVEIYPRPLCKPVQTTLVSAQPDGDGCYTLV